MENLGVTVSRGEQYHDILVRLDPLTPDSCFDSADAADRVYRCGVTKEFLDPVLPIAAPDPTQDRRG